MLNTNNSLLAGLGISKWKDFCSVENLDVFGYVNMGLERKMRL